MPKALANKTEYDTIHDFSVQILEPVLIQGELIGFEAILESYLDSVSDETAGRINLEPVRVGSCTVIYPVADPV